MTFTLATDGDAYEQKYYLAFIKNEFPCYDAFWVKHVVPLTNRPTDIHFKTDVQLRAVGKTEHDLCIAQLHYTVLRHLTRVFEIRRPGIVSVDDLTDGIVRLAGAQDVAFELLERYARPAKYGPWLARRVGRTRGGKEARQAWQKRNRRPLQDIRNYRNHLVHGRIGPGVILNGLWYVPDIGKEAKYYDWRAITDGRNVAALVGQDLATPKQILDGAWKKTVNYLESNWKSHLFL